MDKSVILERGRSLGLRFTTLEKDYVLSWMLAGINQHPVAGKTWVFKGGTCLKKCFFTNYRFSEDLDFTLTPGAVSDDESLTKILSEVAQWVQASSEIEVRPNSVRLSSNVLSTGRRSICGKLNYRGPLRQKTNLPQLKIDISPDERLMDKPVQRPIFHDYAEAIWEPAVALSYSLNEIVAEKICALSD